MRQVRAELADHPDRLRWNARYEDGYGGSFAPHPLTVGALSMELPDGPVLELASGPSGSVLLAAEAGRLVTAVDVSEVALRLLAEEARRRGASDLITLVHADLGTWQPQPGSYALVVCTGFWDSAVFTAAAAAVTAGGMLGWEAFTAEARRGRPGLCAGWCLDPGQPASLLPAGFTVLTQQDLPDDRRATKRRLLARRLPERKPRPGCAASGHGTEERRPGAIRFTASGSAGALAGQADDGPNEPSGRAV